MNNKKNRVLIIICMVLIVGLGTVGGFFLSRLIRRADMINITEGNKADVEWYDPDASEFILTTAEELYELALLSDFYNFEGQTVKLGADIVINRGNASDWEKEAPTNSWYPIQKFAGTFDGQGHTISGLYGVGSDAKMGLFADTQPTCVITNLRIKNSYFEMQGSEPVGSVASNGCGTFRQIYSDAIVISNGFKAGGFVGEIDAAGTSVVLGSWTTFSDCWFDGKVSLTYKKSMYAGGFVGYSKAGTIIIEHCLNSGSVYSKLNHIGGFVGTAWATDVTVNISDSLNTGKLDAEWTNAVSATVGRIAKGASVNFKDTFATSESYGTLYFKDADGKVTGAVVQKSEKELTGEGGYRWTTLDFDNHWAINKDSTPVLQCFTDDIPSIKGLTKAFDTSWYDENLKEFTITTVEELYGFQLLSLTTEFKGKTIKLGNDITVNKGKASQWAKNAPESSWTSISGFNGNFAGTFDGQGHTISGLYGKTGAMKLGFIGCMTKDAVVKDFKLVNSYFENDGEANAIMGGIAGRAGGLIEKVYTDVILVSNARYVGGIVGQDQEALKITECWYDGKIELTGENGWYAGGILGASQGSKETTIEHCLNSADITTEMNHIGGICGYAITAQSVLNIKDCLNVGKLTTVYHKNAVGSIIGRLGNEFVVNIDKTCTAAESWDSAIFKNDKAVINGGALRVEEAKLNGYGGYQWTELDFKNYWAVHMKSTPVLKYFAKSVPSLANKTRLVDTSWYAAKKDTYVLDSLADLYGFALMSIDNTFAGKTIKLGANITVNTGDASTWGHKAPEYAWTSIGLLGETRSFAGTFDGQGYTISGLYQKSSEMGVGLFQSCAASSVVKNLRLTNSYFESTSDKIAIMGSISGRGDGCYENIYSDAILVSSANRVGGIIGQAIGITKVSNCWYDGNITLTGENGWYAGGIVGVTESFDENTIEHCLNTGSLNTEMNHIGGICGYAMKEGSVLNIRDCLSIGTMTTSHHKNAVGSVIGRMANNVTLNVDDTCATLESWECAVYKNDKATINGGATRIKESLLSGYGGYQWTELNFSDYWTVQIASSPVLKSFTTSVTDITGQERLVNTNWYDAAKKEYILTTKQELHGFALLSSDNTFEGKNVKLGANITVNTGDSSTWGSNAPAFSWNSIGILGETRSFNGTFDGQGYNISGLYQKSDQYGVGLFQSCGEESVVKNVILTNSYFESTNDNTALMGSIAGRGAGTYENVISDAIVVSAGSQTGGMIGQSGGVIFMSKCDFRGVLQTSNHYVGGMIGHTNHDITIKNSNFSGDLESTNGMHNAGFIGYAKQAVAITNSKFSGTLTASQDRAGGYIGTSMEQIDISDCINSGKMTIENGKYFGGYIGYNAGGTNIVKSDFSGEIICKGNYSAGFIGYSEAEVDIQQSQFTGILNANAFSGGFIGWQIGESGSIKHCLNNGTIDTTDNQIGSFVGCISNVKFTIDDCLYAGTTPYIPDKWKHLIVGRVHGDNADVTIENTFAQGNAGWIATGLNTTVGIVQDETLVCDGKYLQGINAYVMTTLDFEEYWRAIDGGYPELMAFEGREAIKIPSDTLRAKYDWYYDPNLFDTIFNRYTISDEGDLLGLAIISQRDDFKGYTVKIGSKDIVLNEGWTASATAPSILWMPIGNSKTPFAGTFDGNGKIISGLYVNETTNQAGMFYATTVTSVMKDFTLERSYISNSGNYIGSIVGSGAGEITNVISNATVTGTNNVGGLVGGNVATSLIVTDCEYRGTMTTAGNNVGGIVGFSNKDLKINESLFAGTLTSTSGLFNAGFVGCSNANLEIMNCQNEGTVSAPGLWSGGFVGQSEGNISISNCQNSATLNLTGERSGGFIGNSAGTCNITNSEFTGRLTLGAKNGGGFIGYSTNTVNITDSKFSGHISSPQVNVGGFIGNQNSGTAIFTNSWNSGNITQTNATGNVNVGGFVGYGETTSAKSVFNACLVSGNVTGSFHFVGGFVGLSFGEIEFADCLVTGSIESTGSANSTSFAAVWGSATTDNTYSLYHATRPIFIDHSAKKITGYPIVRTESELKGVAAYEYTTLSETNWKFIEDSYPELKAFSTKESVTIPKNVVRIDETWYGKGTDSSFELYNKEELFGFANLSQTKDFAGKEIKVMKNIEVGTQYTWTPIGCAQVQFNGTFDGGNAIISGLKVNSTSNYAGMFAVVNTSSVIKNFTLTDSSITNSGQYTGSIVGYGNGKLENVKSSANVTGTNVWVGGLVGGNVANSLTITNCEYNGTLTTSSNNVGGLVGISKKSLTISGSKFGGNLNSSAGIFNGGFVGCNDGSLEITNSESSGTITVKTDYAGGFVGHAGVAASITNSKYSGQMVLPTNKSYYGGFVGNGGAQINISNCVYAGSIDGGQIVGGFVGAITKGANILHCLFASNGVMKNSGNQNGGFVGMATGGTVLIDDSLFVGTASCFGSWGALVLGRATVSTVGITNTFAKGTSTQFTSRVQNTSINDQAKKYNNANDLKGLDVLSKISLNKTYWEAVDNDYPRLKNVQ